MLQQDERPAPSFEVACQRCATAVLVKKNSLAHTVVQWTEPSEKCIGMTHVETQPIPETCVYLRASIEAEVRAGNLIPGTMDLPAPDGPVEREPH